MDYVGSTDPDGFVCFSPFCETKLWWICFEAEVINKNTSPEVLFAMIQSTAHSTVTPRG